MAYFNNKEVRYKPLPVPENPGVYPNIPPTPTPTEEGTTPYIPTPSFTGDGTIILYNNNDDNRKINKTPTQLASYNITYKDNTSLMSPTIILDTDGDIQGNYAYISNTGKYYFIENITVMQNGLIQLDLKMDVLKTYATQILNCSGVIARQENTYNLYLPDSEFKVYANNNKKTIAFSRSPFTKNLNYLLTVNGGV